MWQRVRLGDVATVIAGQSPKGENYNQEGIGTPFFQGKKDYGEKYLNPPTVWTKSVIKIAKKDDILMSVRAPVGALNIANQTICIGRGLAAISASSKTFNDYLFYSLVQLSPNLEGNSGAIFNSINKKQIEDIQIPLPPLDEQGRIVARLDAGFAGIDTALAAVEAQLVEAEKLKTAILTTTLTNDSKTWQTTKLGDVCNLVYGKALPKSERLEHGGFPAYGANGIKTRSKNPLYDKPSIIIGRKGSAGELNKINEPFWALDVSYYVKCNANLADMNFLYYFLILQKLPSLARGVKPGVNRNDVYNISINLPPLAEQKQIVAKLDKVFAEIDNFTRSVKGKRDNLKALKTALLAQELQPQTLQSEET